MSHDVNTFDLPEEGFNTDLTTVEVEKLGDVNFTQNVDAVPVGGTTGQVLAKNSNTDYDTEWVTGGGGGGGSGDIKADGTVPFAADQSMGGNQLTNVGYPSAMTNAASKTYIDDKLGIGLTLAPDTTNFATIGNTSIVNGLQVFTGQLVGCLNDSNNDSGIFVVGASSSTFLISPKQMVIVGGNTKGIYTLIAPGNTTYELVQDSSKVDKVGGKSLIEDTEITRLETMTAIFTTGLKTAYDSAVTWISTNGANLLTHLGLTNNPHSVTKTQVGLGNVPNLDTSTTANITDSTNKRFVTDAQQTTIGNTSGANTGDNATNSQYSGLAASKENTITGTNSADFWSGAKTFLSFATTLRATVLTGLSLATNQAVAAGDTVLQAFGYLQKQITDLTTTVSGKQATLVSGANIKTLNDTTLLGNTNIDIYKRRRKTGLYYTSTGIAGSNGTITLNRLFAARFDVGPEVQNFDRIGVVSLGAASSFVRVGIYSDTNGFPDVLIADYGQINTVGFGLVTATINENLSGVVWLVGVGQGAAPSVSRSGFFIEDTIGSGSPYSAGSGMGFYIDSISGALPSTWGSTVNLVNLANIAPKIHLRKT